MTHLMLWCVSLIGAFSGGASLLLHLRPQITREDVRHETHAELERHVERVRQRLRPIPKRGEQETR